MLESRAVVTAYPLLVAHRVWQSIIFTRLALPVRDRVNDHLRLAELLPGDEAPAAVEAAEEVAVKASVEALGRQLQCQGGGTAAGCPSSAARKSASHALG
jgi:hypothetical protein